MLTPETEQALITLSARITAAEHEQAVAFLRDELDRLYGIAVRAWEVCEKTDAGSVDGRTARYIFSGLDPDTL